MAKKFNLRDFQSNLSRQLQAASSRPAASSRLGFRVGTDNWLVALEQTEEVLPVPAIAHVPGTQRWFRGMANIRGRLFAVSDFADFIDGTPTAVSASCRLLIPHQRYGVNAALLVSATLGLNSLDALAQHGAAGPAVWAPRQYADHAGTVWRELDFPALLQDPRFLDVDATDHI
jgi:twitching motility protein PilI